MINTFNEKHVIKLEVISCLPTQFSYNFHFTTLLLAPGETNKLKTGCPNNSTIATLEEKVPRSFLISLAHSTQV